LLFAVARRIPGFSRAGTPPGGKVATTEQRASWAGTWGIVVKKMRIVSAVVCGAALLAGCSQAASPAAQQAAPLALATTTAAAKPPPAPHVLSRTEAGKAYLAMVKGDNASGFAVNRAIEGKTVAQINLAKVKTLAAACVASSRKAIVTASTTLWPVDVRQDMVALVKGMGESVSLCNGLLNARSRSAVLDVWNTSPNGGAGSAAEVIRAKLGLPPVPTG
jgi:hypothetical protein